MRFKNFLICTVILILTIAAYFYFVSAGGAEQTFEHDAAIISNIKKASDDTKHIQRKAPLVVNDTPPIFTIRELQQQYSDYYTLALELLHRARAGDGDSQFALANLLVFCQVSSMVDGFELVDNFRKDIDILLTQDISSTEITILHDTMSELEKCNGFRNTDLKFFDDNNYTNEQVAERTGYWVKKAFENGVEDAAAYLLSMHYAEVIRLTESDFSKVAAMTKAQLEQPTFVTMMSLTQWSSFEHFTKVAWALAQENSFYNEYNGLVFDGNVTVVNCIKARVFSTSQAVSDYDCGENVSRYGTWVQPEQIPEVEAEIKKLKAAWKKGDYAAAGFEALIPLLEHAKN